MKTVTVFCLIFYIYFFCTPESLLSQSISRSLISSYANISDSNTFSLESSMGEAHIAKFKNGTLILGEGFHHRSPSTSTFTTDLSGQFVIELHPNPVMHQLNLHLVTQKATKIRIQIHAVSGRVLLDTKLRTNGEKLLNWDVSNWSPGTYIIHCTSEDRRWMHKQLFVKT
jgi:hypothetical protein